MKNIECLDIHLDVSNEFYNLNKALEMLDYGLYLEHSIEEDNEKDSLINIESFFYNLTNESFIKNKDLMLKDISLSTEGIGVLLKTLVRKIKQLFISIIRKIKMLIDNFVAFLNYSKKDQDIIKKALSLVNSIKDFEFIRSDKDLYIITNFSLHYHLYKASIERINYFVRSEKERDIDEEKRAKYIENIDSSIFRDITSKIKNVTNDIPEGLFVLGTVMSSNKYLVLSSIDKKFFGGYKSTSNSDSLYPLKITELDIMYEDNNNYKVNNNDVFEFVKTISRMFINYKQDLKRIENSLYSIDKLVDDVSNVRMYTDTNRNIKSRLRDCNTSLKFIYKMYNSYIYSYLFGYKICKKIVEEAENN